ncbi:MAG: hypothetical protein LBR08_11900, partial [Bacteroidales bacterium]|nr:hypothetical protein [Bacteroidales bacterium]
TECSIIINIAKDFITVWAPTCPVKLLNGAIQGLNDAMQMAAAVRSAVLNTFGKQPDTGTER